MTVVVACLVLVVAGLVAVVRWGGLAFQAPTAGEDGGVPAVGAVLRRYLWWLNLAVLAGFGGCVLAAGAGGRLAMRLLALTADDLAQGRITEAGEVVGRITVDGTIGFILFQSFLLGIPTGALFLLLRRWLPPGRAGGAAFGLLLLLVAGSRVEPLRAGNPDFDIVGPGLVSVVAFAAVVLLHGMLVAAIATRASRALPLPAARPRALAAYLPLVLLLPFFPIAVAAIVAAGVTVAASRVAPLAQAWRGRAVDLGGRVVLAVAALASAPGFVLAVADIIGRP
jgi:hypothetical protein